MKGKFSISLKFCVFFYYYFFFVINICFAVITVAPIQIPVITLLYILFIFFLATLFLNCSFNIIIIMITVSLEPQLVDPL